MANIPKPFKNPHFPPHLHQHHNRWIHEYLSVTHEARTLSVHVPWAWAKKYSWGEAIQNNSWILNKLNFTEQVQELI